MKPYSLECSQCGQLWALQRKRCVCAKWMFSKLIPCFAPLSTPEETTWRESGGDNAVCQEPAAKNASWFVMGFDAGVKPRVKTSWLGELVFIIRSDGDMAPVSLVDAIRHVAEESK